MFEVGILQRHVRLRARKTLVPAAPIVRDDPSEHRPRDRRLGLPADDDMMGIGEDDATIPATTAP
jgi:hypothetical protein